MPLDLMKSWRFSKGCPSVEYGKFHSYSAGGRLITALSLMDGRSTVTVSTPEQKCVDWPEQKYISGAGERAEGRTPLGQASIMGRIICWRVGAGAT
jgi:hypothetical protein